MYASLSEQLWHLNKFKGSVGKTIYIFLVETKKIKFTRENANTNRILNEIILNTKQ